MSRAAITLKFKMCLFLDETSYWAETLLKDINLPHLMPDADNNFGGSLGLDSRKWWRNVQPKNSEGAMARVDIRKGAREKWKRKHILSCRLRKLNNAFIVGWDKWDGNSYHKQLQQSDFHKQKRSISSSLKIHYPIAWVMRRVRNWWSKRHTTRIWTAKRLVNRHQGRWVGRKRRQSLWRMCFAIS